MGCGASAQVEFDFLGDLMADTVKQSGVSATSDSGPNETAAYRHKDFTDHLVDHLDQKKMERIASMSRRVSLSFTQPIETLALLWKKSARDFSKNEFIGVRKRISEKEWGEYEFKTYEQINAEIEAIARAILDLGFEKGSKVGIYASNRSEWSVLEWACFSAGLIVIPLYDTLGENAVEFIVKQAEVKIAFVSKQNFKVLAKVLEKPGLAGTCQLVSFDSDLEPDQLSQCKLWKDLMVAGSTSSTPLPKPGRDDLAIIMYTSGTTGDPKGAMLSQNNIISAVAGTCAAIQAESTDRHLSYLPLAHIFETVVQTLVIACGGSIAFFKGDIKTLTADAVAAKPTIFIGVPRVYERVYSVVQSNLAKVKGIKGVVVQKAIAEQTRRVHARLPRSAFYDKKVFSQVKMALGGKVRLFGSGAAPLAPHLADFLKVYFGANVVEGYGMTETSGIISLRLTEDLTIGTVGPPMPHGEVKFQDVPEMKYLHTDSCPRGEILVRGPHIFKGYYKNQKGTDEVFEGGWLHTGDIGRYNPNGTISIIDRKKNIFKLAQGEYVAIEKVEMALAKTHLVGQLWGYGDSFQNNLVGVVVPDWEKTLNHAKEQHWPETDYKDIVTKHYGELKNLIQSGMKEMGKKEKLKGFEMIYDITLESDINDLKQGFSVDNDCLTPTFKLKRPQLKERYKKAIADMYENLKKNAPPLS